MERKEASNGLQLIRMATIKLKGNFSALFMGAAAMTTPLILVLFMSILMSILFAQMWIVSIGVVLFVILVGPLQIGYIKYFNGVLNGEQPRLNIVYSQLKFNIFTLRTVYISCLLFIMYILGGLLWIVPAGFAISFYSMTLFFLEKFNYPRLSLAMNECSKKMLGNRLAMFSYKLIFYFIYFLLFVFGFILLCLVYQLSMENLVISWIISMCSVLVFIFLYTLVTVYFHSSNQIFFEDVLSRDEKKKAKVKSTTNTTEVLIDKKENKKPATKSKSTTKETSETSQRKKVSESKDDSNITKPKK